MLYLSTCTQDYSVQLDVSMRWEFKTLKNYIDARQAGDYKLFLVVVSRGLI